LLQEASLEEQFHGGGLGDGRLHGDRTSKDPNANMTGNDLLIAQVCKATNRTKLCLDIFLVFEYVWFSSEHCVTRLVVGTNVDYSKGGALPEESTDFPENAVPSEKWDLMEAIPIERDVRAEVSDKAIQSWKLHRQKAYMMVTRSNESPSRPVRSAFAIL